MTDELEALRGVRAIVPLPNLAVRQAARSRWEGETLALAAPRFAPGARTFGLRAAIAGAAALAIVAGAIFVTRARIDSVKPPHVVSVGPLTETPATEPQVFLLVGSDSRAFVHDAADEQRFGAPTMIGAARSDTIMLVRVDPKSKQTLMVSVPRDLEVAIPGHGTNKINAAYALGGAPLLVTTIKRSFGVPINHVIEVGFPQFAALADELGGLRIQFPVPTRDAYSGLSESPGCTTLAGRDALAFVRSRHYETLRDGQWTEDPKSDLDRVARQQLALRQLATAAASRLVVDPRPLLRTLFEHITVDSGFTADDALRYFAALRNDRRVVSSILPVQTHGAGLLLGPGAQSTFDALAGRETPTGHGMPSGANGGPGGSAVPAPSDSNPTAC